MTYKEYFEERIKKEDKNLSIKSDLAVNPKQFKNDTFYPFLKKLGILEDYKKVFDSNLELSTEAEDFLKHLFDFIFKIPNNDDLNLLLDNNGKVYDGGRGMGQNRNMFFCRAIINNEENIIEQERFNLLEIFEKFEKLIISKNSDYSLKTNEYYCKLFQQETLEKLKKLNSIDFKILYDLCIRTPLEIIEQSRDLPMVLFDLNDLSETFNSIASVVVQTVSQKDDKLKSMQKQLSKLEEKPARRNNYRKIDKLKDERNNYINENYIQNSNLNEIPLEKKFHYEPDGDIKGKILLLENLLEDYRNDRPLS